MISALDGDSCSTDNGTFCITLHNSTCNTDSGAFRNAIYPIGGFNINFFNTQTCLTTD